MGANIAKMRANQAAATQSSSGTGVFNADGVQVSSNIRRQTAVIYDVLSEGPIDGLVDGVSSIRLNDNPVANTVNTNFFQPARSIDASYNSSTGVITDNTELIFSNKATSDGVRHILVEGAKKRTTNTINVTAGNNIVVSTNTSFFAASDAVSPETLTPMIRIDGAGRDGGQLITPITQFINTAAVRVELPPMKTVSGTAAYIDLTDSVDSFSGHTATITAAGVTIANTGVVLSSPKRSTNDRPAYNYQNFGFAFRTGNREQAFLPTPVGIGSASVAHSVSSGNLDTDSSCGMPAPSNFFSNQPSEYTGSPLIITSDQMGVGNASEIDAVKVTIQFPSLLSNKDNGKKGDGYAEYRIQFGYQRGSDNFVDVVKVGRQTISTSVSDYHANGRTKDVSSGVISAKTQQPFNKVFTIDVSRYQPFDKYRITIQRVSPVNGKENSWQQTNAGVVKQIENIITDKLSYPYSAYAAVVVDAEDFSQVPKRGYKIRGLKVKVPSNYFPLDEISASTGTRRTTASYTRNVSTGAIESSVQDWDGNFRGDKKTFSSPTHANHEPVYTNNPIWIFYDLLTNQRYGLGKYLDEDFDFSLIDKYTLFQLAKYCDEAVPDGRGGTEPRFTCNLYIQKDDSAMKVLQNLATLVRSMLVWYNGEVTLGSNIQKGSVYTFTKGNVLDGAFSYSGSANRFRNNQIAVSWNDPENGYKQAVEVVEDHNEIARTGKFRRKNITAYGCTSRGQAQRLGRYHLVTEKMEQEVVSFATGINAAILRPGDVIDVQDPDIADVVASGRVTTSSASSTTVIKTDRDLTSYLNGTDSFNLNLIYPSGGAYLAQPLATINSTNYVQGDLILLDEDGAAIDSHAKASNLKDDSGAVVQTVWSEDVRIETKTVSSFNASSVTVSSAFSSAPDEEVVYTISGTTAATGEDVAGSLKQYIINSVSPDENQLYSISATEYHVGKYDEVDRGWVEPTFPEIGRRPKREEDVPAPSGLTASVVPSGGGDVEQDEFGINAYDVILNWTLPKSTRTDDEGNTLDDVYEHLAGFNIQHNIQIQNEDFNEKDFTTFAYNTITTGSYTLRNVVPGNGYIVRVQTVNTNGYTSGYIQFQFDFPASMVNPFGAGVVGGGLNGGIQKGGSLTATVDINSSSGLITLSNNNYVFSPPSGVAAKIISSGGTTTVQESAFSNLSNGEEGLLLMDYSDNSDCMKALKVVSDTSATEPNTSTKFNYDFLARLGESNNDLTAASGTISSTAGLPDVTGSSTTFTSDFSVGDVIAFQSAGANRFMAIVMHIESNTALTVDRGIPHTYSGVSVHKQGFKLDGLRDSVIGLVKKASNVYTYEPFTNKLKIDDSDEIADNTVNAAIIAQNSIGSVQISTNSIGAAAIIADAINDSHIAANSIDAAMIQAGQIGSSEIAANAIGSVAIAANAITSSQLSANAISEVTVSANSITAVEIASNAIGAAQIAANSIASAEISANSIGSSEISANSVNGTIIVGNAVGSSEISANSVNGIIIAGGAVDTSQIAGSAISAAKIAADAVTNEKIGDNAVNTQQVAANSIQTNELKSNSVTAAIVAANSINTSEITANSVNAVIIAANSIESNQLKANSVNAVAILAGTITNSQIAGNTINSAVIQAGAVDTNQIAANAITSAKIAAGNVDTAEIAADAITNAKIAANAVDTAEIKSGSIVTASIGANAITSAKIAAGNIDTAEIAANAIENAKISSTDSMTLTVGGGSAGGWALTPSTFASTNASGGANASFASAGITLGNAGFISAPQFYIDTDGNAKFKGTLEGNDITVNGSLILPASGGSTSVSFTDNNNETRFITSVGSGAGFYQGFIKLTGGTSHVKTMGFYFIESSATSGTSSGFEIDLSSNGADTKLPLSSSSSATRNHAIYPSPEAVPTSTSTQSVHQSDYGLRPDHFDPLAGEGGGIDSENRVYQGHQSANMPFMFTYTGTDDVNLFMKAQGDSGTDTCTVEARFIKFGVS